MRLNPSQNKLLLVFILVLALSLSGFPGTGAFLTKDLIIATFFSDATFNSSPILGFGLVLAAAFTSFYISRLAYFIFFKKGVEIGKKIVMNWQYIGAMGLLVLLCPFFTGTWLFDFLRQDIESLEIESISKSIFIPLIGFSAAVSGPFLFFVWNRSGEKKLSNPFLEQFSMQLFGEKLYDAIGKASLRLGSIFNFLDQKIWDGIVHLLASAQVLLAEVLSFVDRYVIDGFTYIISGVFKGIGSGLIGLQSQKLRWLFMVIGFTVLCFLIFVAL